MPILRPILELAGSGLLGSSYYLTLLSCSLGAGLRGVDSSIFWLSAGVGFLVLGALTCLNRRIFPLTTARTRSDLWMLVGVLAACASFALVALEWPLHFPGGGGHGMSAGGEANAVFHPWLHAALFFTMGRRLKRLRSGSSPA